MLRKILIPLDGSLLAERAVAPGLQLAQAGQSAVTILGAIAPTRMLVPDTYVMGGYAPVWPDQSAELDRKNTAKYFKQFRQQHTVPGVSLQTQIVDGDPAGAILQTAVAQKTDLIVMSSHGYSGVTHWVLGSVAERVLHATPCPVLVLRQATPIRHMLIPLDGSSLAEEILETAFEVACTFECRVTLLQSIVPLSSTEVHFLEGMEPGMGGSFQSELQTAATRYLQDIAQSKAPGVPVEVVAMHGPAAQGILDYALNHDIDLIAMTTHGRTGLQRWVYGSVTEKVLRHALGCSMLVARPRHPAKTVAERLTT